MYPVIDRKVTALTFLNLSAAFNTIDHSILFNRLEDWLGVTGKALDRLKSYRTGRCQTIWLGDCLPSKFDLPFGVQLGSGQFLVLRSLPSIPLSRVISGHAVPHRLYADDSRLYVSFISSDAIVVLSSLQLCLDSVQSWMPVNKLKLHPDKQNSSPSGMNSRGVNVSLCFQ